MTPLLPQLRPDLSDDYWLVPGTSTDTIVVQNNVRVNIDLLSRVRLARLRRDLGQAEEGGA